MEESSIHGHPLDLNSNQTKEQSIIAHKESEQSIQKRSFCTLKGQRALMRERRAETLTEWAERFGQWLRKQKIAAQFLKRFRYVHKQEA